MKQIPTPSYEYEIEKLRRAYQDAILEILRELERIDVSNLSQANARLHLVRIANILASLDEESTRWVEENVPMAARDGVAKTLVELGIASSVEEAKTIVKFNRANKAIIDAAIADTQADLLAVTQNVSRRVRATVRRVTGEVMRNNYASGTAGRKTITKEIFEGLRKELGQSVNTGIIDASGRRWQPQVYVDMVARTKMMEVHKEATRNEAVQRGAYYGVISRHGATDACRNWEGRIVKLVPDAPGDFPYIDDLPRREIFHPNCRHAISPIKRIDRLPSDIKRLNRIDD